MTIRESELRERLESPDDDVVEAALHEHFEARSHASPLSHRWCLRPSVSIRSDQVQPDPESWLESLGDRVLDLANAAQRLLRARRFERQRKDNPHWPVVVAEGDSWVAHPLVDDIADHLLDNDRFAYAVLGVGAADDLLGTMRAELDHERAVVKHDAKALILSGGGNDLLQPFGDFLRLFCTGRDPARLIDVAAVDAHMHRLMNTMRSLLGHARSRMPSVPIVVHGYDYLRVAERGSGKFLGPLFDAAGIDDPDERQAVLVAIVDRYNEHLHGVVECLEDVIYLDLRSVVPDGEWYDEIHPNGDGFSRVSALFGACLDERLGRG